MKLPCKECGGRCCTYAPIELSVWERVKHKAGADAIVEKLFEGTRREAVFCSKPNTDCVCYFLTEGRCTIYAYRPMACRAVGSKIPCAYVNPVAVKAMIDGCSKRLFNKGRSDDS